MKANYLITIVDMDRSEQRFITVYADDEDHARDMGTTAADLMEEDFHKGREFYVDSVNCLE